MKHNTETVAQHFLQMLCWDKWATPSKISSFYNISSTVSDLLVFSFKLLCFWSLRNKNDCCEILEKWFSDRIWENKNIWKKIKDKSWTLLLVFHII